MSTSFSWGPIQSLIDSPEVTEILILAFDNIQIEIRASLQKSEIHFTDATDYLHFVDELTHALHYPLTAEHPTCEGEIDGHRVHAVGEDISPLGLQISIRKHPNQAWSFEKLKESGSFHHLALMQIKNWIQQKKNFLIVGATGSGKTSVLQACLQELAANERVVILEDARELKIPNSVSTQLLTRRDGRGILQALDLSALLKESLRMRPDRLVLGEVRGPEAKDLLLALSTGHKGSFGSLHAGNSREALQRLEMLVQMGAPQWSFATVRSLIASTIEGIVELEKLISINSIGLDDEPITEARRGIKRLFRIEGIEREGPLLECVFDASAPELRP